MFFWLQDENANTIDLGNTINELTFGGNKRKFDFISAMGDGSIKRGNGKLSEKIFSFTITSTMTNTSETAINEDRNTIISWFSKPEYSNIYLYVKLGEGTKTYKTQIYVNDIGDGKLTNQRFMEYSVKITSPSGIFENISETTGSSSVTANIIEDVVINNQGNYECPIILEYTPSSSSNFVSFFIADEFGLKLEKINFASGEKISINTGNNSITINDVEFNLVNFLTKGSPFDIPPGSFTLKILSDSDGTFDYSFNDRIL